ncbi:MAG: hypothetical protein H6546_04235 [Chitinophagales bacterium]|nr:hypothetical protein [Chitinophagales bacterium]
MVIFLSLIPSIATAQCPAPCDDLSNLATETNIDAHLVPASDNTLDLGGDRSEVHYDWNDLYLDGIIKVDEEDDVTEVQLMQFNGEKFFHLSGSDVPGEGSPSGLFIGRLAGSSSGSKNGNIGIGYRAMEDNTENHNVSIGFFSMSESTTAGKNTTVGNRAGQSISTGGSNTGLGHNVFYKGSGSANLIGSENTAVGAAAVSSNTGVLGFLSSGSKNTSIGAATMPNATTGSENVVVGYGSGTGIATGSENLILGDDAGNQITSGTENIILGSGSGSTDADISSGTGNIIIGANMDLDGGGSVVNNKLVIGGLLFGDMTSGIANQGVGIGASSLTSLFNVGANDEFQVNTNGEIAAYSGLTTAGLGVPVVLAIYQDDGLDATQNGDLLANAEAGLYQITYQGIVTQASEGSSGLIFQFKYTDPAAAGGTGAVVTIPDSNYPYVNYAGDNDVDESVLSGSLLIKVKTGTDIEYKISYQSTQGAGEDAMEYSARIVLTRLN